MFRMRPDLNPDDFYINNMGGDLLILGVHFVFWTLVLCIIELGAFNCLKDYTFKKKEIPKPREDIELDEDVLEEENRVASTDKSKMNIRVSKFRKVYTTLFGKPF